MQDKQLAHQAFKKKLTLENGTQLRYTVQGNGKNVVVLVGLGTPLMNFFSEKFKEDTTLVAIDGLWTHQKDEAVDIEQIQQTDTEKLLQDTSQAIDALRQVYPGQPFGIMGQSILTKLAMECAKRCKDIDFILLSGIPFFDLSLGFPQSDKYFRENADEHRIASKDYLQKRADTINAAEGDIEPLLLPHSNIRNGQVTPNSQLVENFLPMAAQQCYRDNEYYQIVENFRQGVTGRVINQMFYTHFFTTIAPQLGDAETLLPELAEKGIPIVVFSGEQDYTTPVTPKGEQLLSQLAQKYPDKFQWKHYAGCGHYPMTEKATRDAFDEDAKQFFAALPKQTKRSNLQANSMFKAPGSSETMSDTAPAQEIQTSDTPRSSL